MIETETSMDTCENTAGASQALTYATAAEQTEPIKAHLPGG